MLDLLKKIIKITLISKIKIVNLITPSQIDFTRRKLLKFIKLNFLRIN